MSLIHRCDFCKKIIWKDGMYQMGETYSFNSSENVKRYQVKIGDQFVGVTIGLYKECGENGEVCPKCAVKIFKKVWG